VTGASLDQRVDRLGRADEAVPKCVNPVIERWAGTLDGFDFVGKLRDLCANFDQRCHFQSPAKMLPLPANSPNTFSAVSRALAASMTA